MNENYILSTTFQFCPVPTPRKEDLRRQGKTHIVLDCFFSSLLRLVSLRVQTILCHSISTHSGNTKRVHFFFVAWQLGLAQNIRLFEYSFVGLAFDFQFWDSNFEYPLFFFFLFFFNTWHPLRNGSQLVRLADHLQQTIRQWKTLVLTYIFHEKSSISYKHACRFERVKERRRGPAESLTLFSNDWFNLLVCVDLFTHLTYMLFSINVCRNFPHYKLESCGNE